MQKAGAYLKSVREEKGYTIQEISKSTKISSPVLRALEEGRIDNVDPVYLKGFLKLYCRYLGLNWEVFISEYPIPVLAKKQQKASAVKARSKDRFASVAAVQRADIKKEGFSFLKLISVNTKFIAMILAAVAVVLLAVLIFKGFKTPAPVKVSKEAPAKKSVAQAPAKVPVPTHTPAPVPVPVAKAAGASVTGAQKPKPKEITLAIRAQDDSFITLKVDGKIVYQRMMYKGKAETWSAKNKIELAVGNAGGLLLEVNGKPIPLLGKKGQQIKTILINSEGLKVL